MDALLAFTVACGFVTYLLGTEDTQYDADHTTTGNCPKCGGDFETCTCTGITTTTQKGAWRA